MRANVGKETPQGKREFAVVAQACSLRLFRHAFGSASGRLLPHFANLKGWRHGRKPGGLRHYGEKVSRDSAAAVIILRALDDPIV